MDFTALLAGLKEYEIRGDLPPEITGISYDSRRVEKGHLFAALPGVHFQGGSFIPQARSAGAVAVLTGRKEDTDLPCIQVHDVRLALALLSNSFYSNPSNRMELYGVTGTNGKTTTTFLMRSALSAAGFRCGLVGTIRYEGPAFSKASVLTTPESCDLQQMLATMVNEKWGACAMEVSSHSLAQHRVSGCRFEASIFTNLTQDHLDYHHTMEEYFQAKRKLFDNENCFTRIAAINVDDAYGARLIAERKQMNAPVASYGFSENADFQIVEWMTLPSGSTLTIKHPGGQTEVRTPLLARYNAYNICGAFTALASSGVPVHSIVSGIESMKHVPGRLERVDCGQSFLIIIDYAHTEDALRQLLTTLRPYTKRKLIVLFGCGGERDPGKRPLMEIGRAHV